MPKRVTLIDRQQIFQKAIFRIEQATLQHEKFDGSMSRPMTRVSLERGDGVTAVIHNTDRDAILLIEQFRYPTYSKAGGWMLELPAGMLKEGEDPKEAMSRELVEETGCEADTLDHVHTFFLSPGGSSERIFLYYAAISDAHCTGEGGGLESEGEDIRSEYIPVDVLKQRMKDGQITDAKTIIGLQWFLMMRAGL